MKKKLLTLVLCTACVFLAASSCEVTTASLSDVKMCDETDAYQCVDEKYVFSTTTPVIYCTAVLNNAMAGTKVKASWYYLEDEVILIDSASVESIETTSDLEFKLTKPDNDWPKGEYKVVVEIEADNVEPIDVEFSVE